MFKWLFGTGTADKPTPANTHGGNFAKAYDMMLERGEEIKKEYDRTLADPSINAEVTQNLEAYKDPVYIAQARNTIFSMLEEPRYSAAKNILHLTSTMFMTMAGKLIEPTSEISSFSRWAGTFSDAEKRQLVRFAYIGTRPAKAAEIVVDCVRRV